MTRKAFTPEQAHILTLPVILTDKAWRQAVHIEDPKSLSEVAQRLAYALKAAWHPFLEEPEAESVEFTVSRFPPDGDRSHRRPLAMKAQRKQWPDSSTWYLEVSLKFETAS